MATYVCRRDDQLIEAIIGKGTASTTMAIIGGDVTKLVDGRVKTIRMGEAR